MSSTCWPRSASGARCTCRTWFFSTLTRSSVRRATASMPRTPPSWRWTPHGSRLLFPARKELALRLLDFIEGGSDPAVAAGRRRVLEGVADPFALRTPGRQEVVRAPWLRRLAALPRDLAEGAAGLLARARQLRAETGLSRIGGGGGTAAHAPADPRHAARMRHGPASCAYLRWRILARIRRFLRPTLRRPFFFLIRYPGLSRAGRGPACRPSPGARLLDRPNGASE